MNWDYYYKMTPAGNLRESNLLYTPYINPERDTMCIHYALNSDYQTKQQATQEVVDFFFQRELRFLKELKHLSCTPTVLEVNEEEQKILIEFPGETLSQIINDPNRNIDKELPDWEQQVVGVLQELKDNGYLKVSLYPHCFFITEDKKVKTLDYYAVIPLDDPYIERQKIQSMIGPDGAWRFDRSEDDGMLDFTKFYEITVSEHLDNFWPRNPFK
jgi:serine/threonine protein kinase